MVKVLVVLTLESFHKCSGTHNMHLRQSTIGGKKTSGKFLKPKIKNYIFTIFPILKGLPLGQRRRGG
jgi:hypothetical protein